MKLIEISGPWNGNAFAIVQDGRNVRIDCSISDGRVRGVLSPDEARHIGEALIAVAADCDRATT